ncbi:hypothetical protein ACFX10_038500 [Malus domestica]
MDSQSQFGSGLRKHQQWLVFSQYAAAATTNVTGTTQNSDDHHHIAPETLFCYKNEDVANQSYQDFELWKQQKQLLQTQQPWLYQSHTKLNSKVLCCKSWADLLTYDMAGLF